MQLDAAARPTEREGYEKLLVEREAVVGPLQALAQMADEAVVGPRVLLHAGV